MKPNRIPLVLAAAAQKTWFDETLASVQLAAMLALFWRALYGEGGVIFAAVAIAVTVWLSRQLAPLQPIKISPVGLCRFAWHFGTQSLAGGIDVAYRALHPRCPLTPGTWAYAVRLPPGQARALFVGSIGLLPGTVGRSIEGDKLWVHSIAGDPHRSLDRLERRVAGLYGITLRDDTLPGEHP